MNKVISINLNGNAYQLEEGGFEALRAYLDTAARRLEGNPDKAEIIADIEQAIAGKFRSLLGANKTVVVEKEVEDIIAEMGPVEDASGAPKLRRPARRRRLRAPRAPDAGGGGGVPRRLFKIHEGAKIGGVCNGLAAYFNIDVTLVRIAFAFLIFAWGSGLLLYILMWVILPSASTPAEMAAAHGAPSATAQEFIRRAREGYYEGMRTFGDKQAHREWKRRFKSEMRGWKRDFHREMNQRARAWWPGWGPWAPHPATSGAWIAEPVLTMLITLVNIVGMIALISLVATGDILGMGFLPWWPFWARILTLIGIICLLRCPLKAIRRSVYGWGYGWCGPWGGLWCILKWVLIVYMVIWIFGGHGGFHDSLYHLPPRLHHAADSVRQWWNQQ
jgi:phage shock protein PspC (stress-responsive transcriptional regulator)